MNSILIKDQTVGGVSTNEIELQFVDNTITVKDLIISRVRTEVEIYNKKQETPYHGLVVPNPVEVILNKKSASAELRKVDFEEQVYIALDGFLKNQFFVIIGDKQAESLEQEINVKKIKIIEFIKLTPLVGG